MTSRQEAGVYLLLALSLLIFVVLTLVELVPAEAMDMPIPLGVGCRWMVMPDGTGHCMD